MTKVISIRIKPHGQEFVATIIGPRPLNLTSRPILVQREGVSEYDAASAALYALFYGEGATPDADAPDTRTLLRDLLEDAQLVDDPDGYYGYLVSPATVQLARQVLGDD